jgi:hypothetical protein
MIAKVMQKMHAPAPGENAYEAETNAESASALIPCTYVLGLPVYGGSLTVMSSSGCIEMEE